MQTKLDQLRAAWMRGDRIGALRIASRFHDRSDATKAFQRGWQGYQQPAFFRQLGKDPDALTAEALRVLAAKFRLSA